MASSSLTDFGYAAIYRENLAFQRELLCLIDVRKIVKSIEGATNAWFCLENIENLPSEMIYKAATDFLYSCISSIERTDPTELRIQRLFLTLAENETTYPQNVNLASSRSELSNDDGSLPSDRPVMSDLESPECRLQEREYDEVSDTSDNGLIDEHMSSGEELKESPMEMRSLASWKSSAATSGECVLSSSQRIDLTSLGQSSTMSQEGSLQLAASTDSSLTAQEKNNLVPSWKHSSVATAQISQAMGMSNQAVRMLSMPRESDSVKLDQDSLSYGPAAISSLNTNLASDTFLAVNRSSVDNLTKTAMELKATVPPNVSHETVTLADERHDKTKKERKGKKKKSTNGTSKVKGLKSVNKCDVCSAELSSKRSLDHHKRIHTGEKPYQCETCGKAFAHPSVLACHKKSHTGERPFVCTTCGRAFGAKRALLGHIRTHTGERPYCCQICGDRFNNKTTLNNHKFVHSKEKPHACPVCDKRFSQKCNVAKHLTVHGLGPTSIKCDFCEKSFRRKDKLVAHMKTHSGEKPYLCHLCGKSFSSTNYLWQHRKIHDETKYQCPNCGRNYSWAHTLQQHLKTCVEKKSNLLLGNSTGIIPS